MTKLLITLQDINALCRPCYADEEIANAIIAEAMREDVRARIGDALYIRLITSEYDALTEAERTLLDGGIWTDSTGNQHLLDGLKTALSYLVYARIVRDGNILPTRYGSRVKNDENSVESENQERQRQYRQVFASADAMLADCIAYINAKSDVLQVQTIGKMKSNRTRLRVFDSGRIDEVCIPVRKTASPSTFNEDFNNDYRK